MNFSVKLTLGASTASLPHYSDKVLLPQSVLESLVSLQKTQGDQQLPHPLIFRLSTFSNVCYTGVKEFTSDEGNIQLPGMVQERLGLQPGSTTPISVELAADVPKATALTLRPSQIYTQFESDQDWKWFLEARLTSLYTVLTQGEELVIKDNTDIFKLHVNKTAPGHTVCIVDSDIDLDIEPLDVKMAQELANRQTGDSGFVEIQLDESLAVDYGKKVQFQTPHNLPDGVTVSCNTDFALSTDRFVSDECFEQATVNKGQKEIVWKGSGKTIYLLPLGNELATAKFRVTKGIKQGRTEISPDADHVLCDNCGAVISKSAQFMHDNFCRRNNIKCPEGCGEVFLRKVPESHWHCCETYGNTNEAFALHRSYCHEGPVKCSKCHRSFENKAELASHRASQCPGSMHECRFCHLILPRGENTPESRLSGMSGHEYECGSKTTECYKCGKVLRRRDLESHTRLHELDRVSKPKPVICSNKMCVRPITSGASANVLGLCDVCFGPLFSTMYDPSYSRLRSRIERKYLLQLRTGCGNLWCDNPLCGSSSRKPESRPFGEIMKVVKNELVPKDLTQPHEYCFCVDEAMTRRRNMADALKEDPEMADYDGEWVCKAIDTVRALDDEMKTLSRVRGWLGENGVKREEYVY